MSSIISQEDIFNEEDSKSMRTFCNQLAYIFTVVERIRKVIL